MIISNRLGKETLRMDNPVSMKISWFVFCGVDLQKFFYFRRFLVKGLTSQLTFSGYLIFLRVGFIFWCAIISLLKGN